MAEFLDDVYLWHFRGVAFAAKLTQGADWDQWFEETIISTTEPILGSDDMVTDVGGKTYGALPLAATFNTPEERASFNAMLGMDGVLTSPSGDERNAMLAKTKKIGSGTNAYSRLDTTFNAV